MATAGAAALLLEQVLKLEKVKKAGAVSYETRKSSDEIHLSERELTMLAKMRWVKKTDDGKYYAVTEDVESKLRRQGALSSETATSPEEAGITSLIQKVWLEGLIERGKVGETEDGRIWWKEQTSISK